jgi:hypothetical protein
MRTYLSNIINRITWFSKNLDIDSVLSSTFWVLIDDQQQGVEKYIFRKDGGLLISTKGLIRQAKWELMAHQSIIITSPDDTPALFRIAFLQSQALVLQLDDTEQCLYFVAEDLYLAEKLRRLEFEAYLLKLLSDSISAQQEEPTTQISAPQATQIINDQYYYKHQRKEFGPVSSRELFELLKNKEVLRSDYVRTPENKYSKDGRIGAVVDKYIAEVKSKRKRR